MGTARLVDPPTNPSIWDYGVSRHYSSLPTWEDDFAIVLTSGFHKANISSVSGDFDPLESLSWTSPQTGTGTLYGFDDPTTPTIMYYILLTGTLPDNGQSDITGGNESATLTVDSHASTNTGMTPVLELYDDTADKDDRINLSGATSSSSFFRFVRAASGQGHDGTSNNGVNFKSTANASVFRLFESFVHVQDIICTISANHTSNARYCVDGRDGSRVVGVICFDSINTGTGNARDYLVDGDDIVFVLCLSENPEQHCLRAAPGAGNTAYFYNCAFIDAGSGGAGDGVLNANGTVVCKNVLSKGAADDDFDPGTYTGSVNCASGDASTDNLPAGSHRKDQTFTFVNAAGNDYHLADGDAGAKDFGTDLSADAVFAFDDDISDGTMGGEKSGELFNVWDIGFDEPNVATAAKNNLLLLGVS